MSSSIAEAVHNEPKFEQTIKGCVRSLARLANHELDDSLQVRMRWFGEQKDFLGEKEHADLLALITFTEQRTRERPEAQLALQQLTQVLPDVVETW